MIAKVLVGFVVFVYRIFPLKGDIKATKDALHSLTYGEMSLEKWRPLIFTQVRSICFKHLEKARLHE